MPRLPAATRARRGWRQGNTAVGQPTQLEEPHGQGKAGEKLDLASRWSRQEKPNKLQEPHDQLETEREEGRRVLEM